jgi:transketolase N-terminal domain/subunit
MMTIDKDLENSCINTIRTLSADAVQNANAGHPGMPMGAAAIAYTLWTRFFRHNPQNPQWFDRDRFVLSAGMDLLGLAEAHNRENGAASENARAQAAAGGFGGFVRGPELNI